MILGITGGIATGKSTVTDMLATLGVRIIDADDLSHYLTRYDTEILRAIRQAFGVGVFQPYGALDRPALARIVFSDESARLRLEAIVHPGIVRSIENNIAYARSNSEPLVVSAPLLIEAGHNRLVDRLWVVSCREELQLERLCLRPGMTAAAARARIAAQLPLSTKEQLADSVIWNNGSIEELHTTVLKEWNSIVKV